MTHPVRRIFMTPDYREGNPYQELLRESLARCGVEVVFPQGYRRGLPLLRSLLAAGPTAAIHLHWLSPFLKRYPGSWGVWFGAIRLAFEITVSQTFLGRRLIWTVHNLESHEGGDQPAERWLRRWLSRVADALIVHTDDARGRVAERYQCTPAKIRVVRHGHYRDFYGSAPAAAEARRQLGLPVDGTVFLFLGMLRAYKGLAELIAAWQERPAPGDCLVLAGEPYATPAGEWRPPEAEGLLCRLGRVPDAAIPVWLAACDFFVLPIRDVLTSGSLVLATSYGVPVIAPRYPMVVEVVGESSLLYDPAELKGLARAIARAAALRRNEAGRTPIPMPPAPDWDAVAAETFAIYQRPQTQELVA